MKVCLCGHVEHDIIHKLNFFLSSLKFPAIFYNFFWREKSAILLAEQSCSLHLLHLSNALLKVGDKALLVIVGPAGKGGSYLAGVLGL